MKQLRQPRAWHLATAWSYSITDSCESVMAAPLPAAAAVWRDRALLSRRALARTRPADGRGGAAAGSGKATTSSQDDFDQAFAPWCARAFHGPSRRQAHFAEGGRAPLGAATAARPAQPV